ncbi:MAG: tetraacyldisaccharide 4'-kinase [Caldithrix sp.]|nr:tetraacyldisaccharide 4'-kinase [Caldithrix sp.]
MKNTSKWIMPLRILLIPAGWLYGLVTEIRNLCYDWGIFKISKFDIPIISIGNITAGGSGKTPFTIALAQFMQENYKTIAIISRGYGRKIKGTQMVCDGHRIKGSAEELGDEPVLIARRLPGLVVVVSENRVEGVRFVSNRHKPDLIILDDAFQHRRLHRDIDVVLVHAGECYRFNQPLPAGTLREFKHQLKRANHVILSNADEKRVNDHPLMGRSTATTTTVFDRFIDLENKTIPEDKVRASDRVAAFCAIAKPEGFMQLLLDRKLNPAWFEVFKDHHIFTKDDLTRLTEKCRRYNINYLICTEKDMVKLQSLNPELKTLTESGTRIIACVIQLKFISNENYFIQLRESIDNK